MRDLLRRTIKVFADFERETVDAAQKIETANTVNERLISVIEGLQKSLEGQLSENDRLRTENAALRARLNSQPPHANPPEPGGSR